MLWNFISLCCRLQDINMLKLRTFLCLVFLCGYCSTCVHRLTCSDHFSVFYLSIRLSDHHTSCGSLPQLFTHVFLGTHFFIIQIFVSNHTYTLLITCLACWILVIASKRDKCLHSHAGFFLNTYLMHIYIFYFI